MERGQCFELARMAVAIGVHVEVTGYPVQDTENWLVKLSIPAPCTLDKLQEVKKLVEKFDQTIEFTSPIVYVVPQKKEL